MVVSNLEFLEKLETTVAIGSGSPARRRMLPAFESAQKQPGDHASSDGDDREDDPFGGAAGGRGLGSGRVGRRRGFGGRGGCRWRCGFGSGGFGDDGPGGGIGRRRRGWDGGWRRRRGDAATAAFLLLEFDFAGEVRLLGLGELGEESWADGLAFAGDLGDLATQLFDLLGSSLKGKV